MFGSTRQHFAGHVHSPNVGRRRRYLLLWGLRVSGVLWFGSFGVIRDLGLSGLVSFCLIFFSSACRVLSLGQEVFLRCRAGRLRWVGGCPWAWCSDVMNSALHA